MTRRRMAAAAIAGGLLAAAGISSCSLAGRRGSGGGLSAAEIVARSVAARGGLDAWRKVETMVWIGHVESAHAPAPSMPFTLEQARPNRTRLQIEALGARSVRVFDGARGWKVPPSRGAPAVEPYTAQELRSAQGAHGIDGPLVDAAARREPVTLAGVDRLGDRRAYHLKLRPATGGEEDVWVDAETWLEVRHDRTVEGPAGARRVSVTYGDYRAVEGLRIPFLVETGGGSGAQPDRMRIDRVVLNAPLDEATFGNPADPVRRRRAPSRFPAPGFGAPPQRTAALAPRGAGGP